MLEVDGKFYFVTVEQILDKLGLTVTRLQGENLMLCCPIHGERNPSFGIHTETGLYHCFSCGARGNILALICEVENISVQEAKKYISQLHTNERAIPKLAIPNFSKLNISYDLYQEHTLGGNDLAIKYLATRNISANTVSLFNISSDNNDCVIFPICDLKGKVISFQKRFVSTKKFLFESGFNKNEQIFGLDVLREYGNVEKPLFITESVIDCLTVWEYGGQSVCVFSAHMTKNHVKLLSQTPYRIIADGLDRDLAGRLGWERAEALFIEKGFRTISMCDHGKKDINELTESEFRKWGLQCL